MEPGIHIYIGHCGSWKRQINIAEMRSESKLVVAKESDLFWEMVPNQWNWILITIHRLHHPLASLPHNHIIFFTTHSPTEICNTQLLRRHNSLCKMGLQKHNV